MDLYHLTNLILLLDGYFESLLDHIFFSVHYLIRQSDGVREHSDYIGVVLRTKRNQGSSHSR
jgi:hypothetical protein